MICSVASPDQLTEARDEEETKPYAHCPRQCRSRPLDDSVYRCSLRFRAIIRCQQTIGYGTERRPVDLSRHRRQPRFASNQTRRALMSGIPP